MIKTFTPVHAVYHKIMNSSSDVVTSLISCFATTVYGNKLIQR